MSTETQDKLDDIKVSEEKDGSVVVDLPDHIQSPDASDDDDDKDDGKETAHADGGDVDEADHPDDTEAIRAARRNQRRARKEMIKQKNVEKDIRLQNLQRQNQELMERLSVVERKTHSADVARIDKALEDQELRLQYAKMKMAEATSASDGDAFSKAQDMWYETRRQIESIKALKEQAVRTTANQPIEDNREMQRQASKWMDRNQWYDPNGDDEDVEIAKVVDQRLVKEGWNPNSSEYWEELDRRLQKRIPHRYTDGNDERPTRRPRSVVTSSGRENITGSGARNTFTLTPEQVRAMKDAGFWDDSEKRNKMIKRYAQEARQSNGYRS
jgi:hypothetical protein